MNSNRRVLRFVLYSTGILLLFSILAFVFDWRWEALGRVNLVADIVTPAPGNEPQADTTGQLALTGDSAKTEKNIRDFSLYHSPRTITNFNADTLQSALPHFAQKLSDLQAGKKTKIRIAYFGDSMIEGDLLTQTLRQLLQQRFGGSGVGFVPVTSAVSKFRQTVRASYPDNWKDESFKSGKSSHLYLSGHTFSTAGAWVQMTDNTKYDSTATVEKSLLYGRTNQPVTISVNDRPFVLQGGRLVNRTVLANDAGRTIKVAVNNEQLPVYGISFESGQGVFLDNFSFRGITGIEFARVDSAFLGAIAAENPYDLIIFQYGVNLLFRPNDKNFSWYAKAMMPVVQKIKNCFPASDFILVSTADRAFRYGGEYKSAVGIDSLIKVQAMLAYEAGTGFYNQYETMGGKNSIVNWAKQKPALANQDYVHPNHRGAELLAGYFYEAILRDYKKYLTNKK